MLFVYFQFRSKSGDTATGDVHLEATIQSPVTIDGRVITNIIQKKLLKFSSAIA
jgi:hypothetical protein